MTSFLLGSLLAAILQPGIAAEDVEHNQEATSHSDAPESTGGDASHGSEHGEELHAANAILFLFVALTVGIILRRAVTGFIIPYTGLLVVRFASAQSLSDIFIYQACTCSSFFSGHLHLGIARGEMRQPSDRLSFNCTLCCGSLYKEGTGGEISAYIALTAGLQIIGLAVGLIDQKATWEHMGQGIQIWLVRPKS